MRLCHVIIAVVDSGVDFLIVNSSYKNTIRGAAKGDVISWWLRKFIGRFCGWFPAGILDWGGMSTSGVYFVKVAIQLDWLVYCERFKRFFGTGSAWLRLACCGKRGLWYVVGFLVRSWLTAMGWLLVEYR